MLFRPSFCANCGEKIDRAEWRIWTSRRFCEVCETEFKGQDLIPRVVVGLGVLAGIFGFGSYLKTGSAASDVQPIRQAKTPVVQTELPAQPQVKNSQQAETANSAAAHPPNVQSPALASKTLIGAQVSQQLPKPKVETGEAMYFCGAATKKGTPCSRRVKGNVRCYQHVGMPAMLPAGKLRVS